MNWNEKANRMVMEALLRPLNEAEREAIEYATRRHYSDLMTDHPWTGEVLRSLTWSGGGMLVEFEHGRWGAARTDGDCCAQVWFEAVEPAEFGGVIIGVRQCEWVELSESEWSPRHLDDVQEVYFWSVITTKGTFDIETRLSHNGYYGGNVLFSEPTSGDDSRWWDPTWNDWNRREPCKRGNMPRGYCD